MKWTANTEGRTSQTYSQQKPVMTKPWGNHRMMLSWKETSAERNYFCKGLSGVVRARVSSSGLEAESQNQQQKKKNTARISSKDQNQSCHFCHCGICHVLSSWNCLLSRLKTKKQIFDSRFHVTWRYMCDFQYRKNIVDLIVESLMMRKLQERAQFWQFWNRACEVDQLYS